LLPNGSREPFICGGPADLESVVIAVTAGQAKRGEEALGADATYVPGEPLILTVDVPGKRFYVNYVNHRVRSFKHCSHRQGKLLAA